MIVERTNFRKRILDIAEKYIGVKEQPAGSNSGPVINVIQAEFGFSKVQYCVLFTLYCIKKACDDLGIEYTIPVTASSQTLFGYALERKAVNTNFNELKVGDIIIWRKFKLWQGHAALAVSGLNELNTFITIEGNTSNSDYGSQRDGDGIYRRVRKANKIDFTVDNFYLRGFINITKMLGLDDERIK